MIQANYYPPNGYPYEVCADFRGESTDTKPSDVSEGSTFHEWDTGNEYMFDGEEWLLQTSGGGGGITVGTLGGVIICNIVQGVPDPSTTLTYDFYASYGTTLLCTAQGVPRSDFAAGLNIELTNFSDTILNDPDIALYDFDFVQGTLTEIPDALTIEEYQGTVSAFKFTMPDVQDNTDHFAIIGIPSGD